MKERKATLENLAKNLAYKVKRTRRPVSLEPMNPYERRVIHSALQNDRYVETHSEGEEPYRKVVITLKKDYRERNSRSGYNRENRYNRENNYNRERGYRKEVLIAAKKKSTKLRIIMRITIVMIMSDADSTPEAFLNV